MECYTTVPNGTRISLGYLVPPTLIGLMSSSMAKLSIGIRWKFFETFHVFWIGKK